MIQLGDLEAGASLSLTEYIKIIPPTSSELIQYWSDNVTTDRLEWFKGLSK